MHRKLVRQFVDTRASADFTGYSPQYFRNAIRSGHLPAVYALAPGRRRGRWLIDRRDLGAFLRRIGFTRHALLNIEGVQYDQ